ncbi:MAG: 30S ribosomal protein S8 [Candidatus Micrarchaeota archaeon]|jgi:small subunit ribosomal protein S8
MVDTLADALNTISVSETKGRDTALLRRPSKILMRILEIFQIEGYVEKYESLEDSAGVMINVKLSGKINKCKAIKPRFSVKSPDWDKWESRYLPAKGIGTIIISTSSGIMTHKDAKDRKIGGRLIAFVY